jgi:hypothetical protein
MLFCGSPNFVQMCLLVINVFFLLLHYYDDDDDDDYYYYDSDLMVNLKCSLHVCDDV